MTKQIQLDIVSAEASIFSGMADMVLASGEMGDLGIPYGHAQLLTTLKPGYIRVIRKDSDEELFYISGGFLEVQPDKVTVLADVAARAADLDEVAVLEAKKHAENLLKEKHAELDYAAALAELAHATAQLRAIQALRKKIR